MDERIADLETRIAHQEKALDELGETVRAQWSEIDRLRNAMELAAAKIEALEAAAPVGAPEAPPPHY